MFSLWSKALKPFTPTVNNLCWAIFSSVGVMIKGVDRNFGHLTSYPSEPVCYLSSEIVFNTFHSVLQVAEIAGARLVQVYGNC